jgi:hypothetical protein
VWLEFSVASERFVGATTTTRAYCSHNRLFKETIIHTRQSVALNPQDKSKGLSVPCSEPDYDPRVERAEEIFAAYEREHGEEGEHLQNLVEMLRDFNVWCDRNGYKLVDVVKLVEAK